MDKAVLLIVDVQNIMVEDHPYNIRNVIDNIRQLLASARANHIEVVYVRHCGKNGSGMEPGTDGWQIYHEISPLEGEKIFDKNYNSAFRKTGLKEYLEGKGISTIILTGMQTEYCIDTTCKCAFEYEFKVIIPEETNSTYDNDYLTGEQLYRFYNDDIWDKRYAEVQPRSEVIRYIEQK